MVKFLTIFLTLGLFPKGDSLFVGGKRVNINKDTATVLSINNHYVEYYSGLMKCNFFCSDSVFLLIYDVKVK